MPELKQEQVTIIVDTREQTPFSFHPMKMEEGTLQSGDYTIKGLEPYVRVERKSLPDLVSCMVESNRKRFKSELERLKAFPKRIVVVEGSYGQLAEGDYRSRLHPNAAMGAIASWCGFFQIGFHFAGNRELAQKFTHSYLFLIAKNHFAQSQRFGNAK